MSSDGFPVLDTLLALRLVARTTLLFHLHGRRAVARATRAAMKGEFEGDIEACVDRSALLRVQRAVRRAVRIWPGRPRCLQLALVTHAMLKQRGIASVVCIGVQSAEGELRAHAWVESGGVILDDNAPVAVSAMFGGDSMAVIRGGLSRTW